MKVLEVIKSGAEFLAKKDVESPRLQVELLLAEVLVLPRMGLYLNFERILTPPEIDRIREMLKRRARREPLQHILGHTSFCGLDLLVNRNVLVPRPETEMLAEFGWNFLNQQLSSPHLEEASDATDAGDPPQNDGKETLSVLDFGTGSGCLAILLATKSPQARVYALDKSPEALETARQNAAKHGVEGRISFWHGDAFGSVPAGQTFDLIVSNPPYIPSGEIPTLDAEVSEFDPLMALDGGADGLDFYRLLATESARFLKSDGCVALEFGDGQAAAIQRIFEQENWQITEIHKDLSGRERMLTVTRSPEC